MTDAADACCFFINRDAAPDRRANLEAAFAAAAPQGWRLVRVAAFDGGAGQGRLTPAEVGCLASHRRALGLAADSGREAMIVEDDTLFSPLAFEIPPGMLAQVPDCDLIFTELMPTDLALLANLARQWRELAARGQFSLRSLERTGFIGASAYVVRPGAAARVLEALDRPEVAGLPYDIALGQLIRAGVLRGRFVFPFLTAPSADADRSSIQASDVDLRQASLHAFRRLMFVGRDLEALAPQFEALEALHADPAARMAGAVFAALVSERFPDSW